jgi:ureidoglycolate hydrolase
MGERRVIAVEAQPLGSEAFGPFGTLPRPEGDPEDRVHLHFEWDDAHLNLIEHRPDEVARGERGWICGRMYRHDTHTQALVPLNCDCVLAVAPATVDFAHPDDLDSIRAFHLSPLEAFVLHQGTWHWGPFPTGAEAVRLLNLQGWRYREDNAAVDLVEAAGATVEVVP